MALNLIRTWMPLTFVALALLVLPPSVAETALGQDDTSTEQQDEFFDETYESDLEDRLEESIAEDLPTDGYLYTYDPSVESELEDSLEEMIEDEFGDDYDYDNDYYNDDYYGFYGFDGYGYDDYYDGYYDDYYDTYYEDGLFEDDELLDDQALDGGILDDEVSLNEDEYADDWFDSSLYDDEELADASAENETISPRASEERAGSDESSASDQSASIRVIEVVAEDFDFDPSTIQVHPGQKVRVQLINRGDVPHNIEFELPGGEVEFEQPVSPGQSKSLIFTAPEKAGKYVLYCPVANHRAKGMEGQLIVKRQEN